MINWRQLLSGSSKRKILISGTPLAEGTQLVICSMCLAVVPALAFPEHGKYHENIVHVQLSEGDEQFTSPPATDTP